MFITPLLSRKTDNGHEGFGSVDDSVLDLHDGGEIFVVESLDHVMKEKSIDGLKGLRMYVTLLVKTMFMIPSNYESDPVIPISVTIVSKRTQLPGGVVVPQPRPGCRGRATQSTAAEKKICCEK